MVPGAATAAAAPVAEEGGAIVAVGEMVINGEDGILPVHIMDDALPRVIAVSAYRGRDLEMPTMVRYRTHSS